MSSNIWMQCGGDSEQRPLRLTAWRVVESQHEVSTRKLVQSAAEQALLEELVEAVKPPALIGTRLPYLLFTPFRYPPLQHGSRFGPRRERGLWYGAEELRTAFAEVAYYRLVFLEGSRAKMDLITTALTAFTVRMRSAHGVNLEAPPFDSYRDAISSRVSYFESQALGSAMRAAGVELFRFRSARDLHGGTNVGAFTSAVFHAATPQHFQQWYCAANSGVVEFTRAAFWGTRELHVFARAQFLVAETLPMPGI